jgi:nucleoside-diphosphate-sugar epimerase
MRFHLHLLGGAGRIGTALVESLQNNPWNELGIVWIYCDSTKVAKVKKFCSNFSKPIIKATHYSAFSLSNILRERLAEDSDKHVVVNLRGINNKIQWLNQPLDALELQLQACRTLVGSDLWMFPGVEIIHMSSQLCDLIESAVSLDKICEGQESYRRPYMISRLHQEAILTASAFQHGISTSFVRLPAVYGFPGDDTSPWVLNSLCKQLNQEGKVEPRNPDRSICLTHRLTLMEYLRSLIEASSGAKNSSTVRYLRPPMLQMSVKTLALLVESKQQLGSFVKLEDPSIKLFCDAQMQNGDSSRHLELLESTIESLLTHG